jgi:glycosidase
MGCAMPKLLHGLALFLSLLLVSPVTAQPAQHPHQPWTRNATIYEVNIRQYTPEGTISAFEKQLPRLKRMGVKILWIMPVQPIGEKNRKGGMGSYYSIRDYTSVNPEFGSMADFKRMVKTAHAMDMKVILDWVANHTAWDSKWAVANPEWFKRNAKGELTSYEYDNGREIEYWTDVIGLDYRKSEVWDAMIDAMKFWVKETGIDGFRCDVASLMPIPFWMRARAELDAIKPMFMLAESNDPAIHAAFDMTYDWKLFDAFVEIAQGKADANALRHWIKTSQQGFPADSYRMTFTSNHDINSWRWSDKELYGEKFRVFATLAATLPGMPLVYSGQESGLDKKVVFFEKDAIAWRRYDNAAFYRRLLALKKRHPSLANGAAGGAVQLSPTSDEKVFAFTRVKHRDKIFVAVNLSSTARYVHEVSKKIEPWGVVIRE